MSISDTESHPAFYHSKKRIWDFPITLPASNSNRPTRQTKLNAYCVCGFDSLWKLWYAVFVVLSTCLLFWLAIVRYQEFKAQSFHPRFGFDWNWSFPLNLQVACLVAVVCLFPLLIYASVSRVGHSANDGIVLGRDCLHLHAMLAQLPCFRLAQRSADPEAAERLRARIAHSTQSLNEATQSPDFESFIIQDRVEALEHASWYVATRRQLRPFACLIHVLIAFALLLPVCVFEAEQIKNEAIPPVFAFQPRRGHHLRRQSQGNRVGMRRRGRSSLTLFALGEHGRRYCDDGRRQSQTDESCYCPMRCRACASTAGTAVRSIWARHAVHECWNHLPVLYALSACHQRN
ncbi:hypothetical protein EGR_00036 [Echinococcus granulosus]|uniref:Uncharacterized protein n=1 Tax=Echinococcus granulosus TaxID=6210 RepID=W6V1F7_ECHGR|nr:hypothetical protein EGR_00036 [Echinococcus granulosus]EUB64767.1 hypothetical protein EGR_00036 [Echinococcus granulosus]